MTTIVGVGVGTAGAVAGDMGGRLVVGANVLSSAEGVAPALTGE
ncbi:hypothetical protein [Arthrobacter sp. FW306-04-A]